MTTALLGVMGYQCWGEEAHEWVGSGLFVLFIIHHILNGNWHRNLLRGKYTPVRMLQTGINLLVFLAMLGLMVSGVMMSNYVFDFLPIHGGMSFARLLHMAASHWDTFSWLCIWDCTGGCFRGFLESGQGKRKRIFPPGNWRENCMGRCAGFRSFTDEWSRKVAADDSRSGPLRCMALSFYKTGFSHVSVCEKHILYF